jgi:hypothetical protein
VRRSKPDHINLEEARALMDECMPQALFGRDKRGVSVNYSLIPRMNAHRIVAAHGQEAFFAYQVPNLSFELTALAQQRAELCRF